MERGEEWLRAVREKHPLDTELFGTMGAVTAELCADVSKEFIGKQYEFMDPAEFNQIVNASISNRVYWRETLFRVHWAAALSLMRHQRWQMGCIDAFTVPANFLGFAASLRGLVEASLDANYSLRKVPYTLTNNRAMIESALVGKLQQICDCEELEEYLIHFVYGRKVAKAEKATTPASHAALEPKDYRNAIGLPEHERQGFRELYDELSGACHPTAFSLTFLWGQAARGNATVIRITAGEDDARIRNLCQKYKETIEFAMSLGVSMSAFCLKALNWFSLPEVGCPSIERWNFDDVPAWTKMQGKPSSGTVH